MLDLGKSLVDGVYERLYGEQKNLLNFRHFEPYKRQSSPFYSLHIPLSDLKFMVKDELSERNI